MNQNFHLEGACSFSHKLSNCTTTDQTNSATLKSEALCEHPFVPLAVVQHLVAFSHASVDREHHANSKLSNSVRVFSWAVCDINALLGAVLNVDRVSSGAGSNNKLELGRGINVCDNNFGGSDDQDVWLELSELCSKGLAAELVVVSDFNTGLLHFVNGGW